MNPLQNVIPRLPLGQWAESFVEWIRVNLRGLLNVIAEVGDFLTTNLTSVLLFLPDLVMVVLFALVSWLFRSWRLAAGVAVSFLLIISMNQWTQAMQTLAIVIIATLTAIIIAVPLGVWAARNDRVSVLVRPVLDLMQTMPGFVYLIPAVLFFSIGPVPGLFATIIFALPPGVRLTELGIRQVDSETVEAGQSFGATDWEILRGIQLPLAIPSIMAGVNQVIMLALSMAVIAGLVGADGLGKEVVAALDTVNIGRGAEAGLSIVFLAVFLDRLTSALGAPSDHPRSLIAMLKKRRSAKNLSAATAA